VRIGKVYDGKVTSVKEFGAFIEIMPGRDGLCHISELDDKYVGRVEDVCKVGDRLQVKVIAIDDQDRVKLSRRALLREQNPQASAAPTGPGGPGAGPGGPGSGPGGPSSGPGGPPPQRRPEGDRPPPRRRDDRPGEGPR
jgi:polyribonucleotide nucleotidyltransferase